jgi:type IV secretion system protein VirD4
MSEADDVDPISAVFRARKKVDAADRDTADERLADAAAKVFGERIREPLWPRGAWKLPERRSFQGNHIRYVTFDPMSSSARTARINPLDAIRVGTPYEVRDAERIAEALLGVDRVMTYSVAESHFTQHGVRVLSALMLHVLYTPETERTLTAILRTITDPIYYDLEAIITEVSKAVHDHDVKMGWRDASGKETMTHPAILQRLRSARTMSHGERSGIFTTVTRGLAIFADPLVAANTEATDFDYDDLFDGLALFVRTPKRGERLWPILDVISSILNDRLEERLGFGPLRYPPFLTDRC